MKTAAQKRQSRAKEVDLRYYERINTLQVQIPGAILVAILLLNLFGPKAENISDKFLHIQYCDTFRWYHFLSSANTKEQCGKGVDDAYLVFTGILFFTMLRAFTMSYVFTPLARSQGISRTKPLLRFAEQAWGFTYALSSWSCGMYLFYHSSYWLNMNAFYETWPELRLDPTFKLYYLMQMAFWLQCILALNLEAKRKDYVQMFGHHILTSTLLIGSYAFNTTRVGHVILTLMDFADIFLPLAKMLKYMGYQTLCDSTFVLFLISWATTRHYLLVKIIMHAHAAQPITLRSGRNITWFFIALLSGLEFLIILWSFAIARVLWGVLRGGNADDTRSDSEDSDSEGVKLIDDVSALPDSATNGGVMKPGTRFTAEKDTRKTK